MESRISVGPIPVAASIWNGTLVLPKSNPIKLRMNGLTQINTVKKNRENGSSMEGFRFF